jgi:protein TonB
MLHVGIVGLLLGYFVQDVSRDRSNKEVNRFVTLSVREISKSNQRVQLQKGGRVRSSITKSLNSASTTKPEQSEFSPTHEKVNDLPDTQSGAESDVSSVEGEYRPSPVYPAIARARKWEGEILIEVETDPTGKIKTTRLLKTSGYSVLDEAALEVLKLWKTRPSKTFKIPFLFRLGS